MLLQGKVQTARVGMFFDGVELVVTDKEVIKPMGGRPQYSVKVIRGLPGLEELRTLKKQGAGDQDLYAAATQIPLPQEDQVIPLIVLDITGNKGYKTLLCEIATP